MSAVVDLDCYKAARIAREQGVAEFLTHDQVLRAISSVLDEPTEPAPPCDHPDAELECLMYGRRCFEFRCPCGARVLPRPRCPSCRRVLDVGKNVMGIRKIVCGNGCISVREVSMRRSER